MFAEQTAVSTASHPCPYIAYFGPVHPSSSSSAGTVSEPSNFSTPWNGPSLPNDMPASYAFPTVDVHYHSWEHHSAPFPPAGSRLGAADPPSISPASQRPSRSGLDIPRSGSFMQPFVLGHRYLFFCYFY